MAPNNAMQKGTFMLSQRLSERAPSFCFVVILSLLDTYNLVSCIKRKSKPSENALLRYDASNPLSLLQHWSLQLSALPLGSQRFRVVQGAAATEGKFTREGSSLSVTCRNQGIAASGQRVNFKRRLPLRAWGGGVISSGEENAFLIYFKN